MTVFMFDRDYTVDVNPKPGRDSIPLRLVKFLAHETDHPVFATGNQHLRREALIPGVEDARKIWEKMHGYDPNDRYEDESYFDNYKPSRENCVKLVRDIHPDHNEFIVFDDANLKHLHEDGINHFYPWHGEDYIRENFQIPNNIKSQDNQPENAKDNCIEEHLDKNNFIDSYV